MRQQPGFDRLSIIRVAVGRYYWLPHELSCNWTREFVSQHLMGPEGHDDGPLGLGRARFLFHCCAAVVGVARRVGHGFQTIRAAAGSGKSALASRC